MDLPTRVTEIEEFFRFAMTVWPALRSRHAGEIARRCERCVLSERCAPLADGLCPACQALASGSAPVAAAAPTDDAGLVQALTDLLHGYEGRGRGQYDALVLLSGGKDSALLLHRLRTQFPGLRLLALTVDNGYFSPVALANTRYLLERLPDVDHLVFRPQASLYTRTFRHAFTHLNEGGCYTTVDRMDGDLTFDIGRNQAALLGIPLLIAGLSRTQAQRILGLDSFETRPSEERERRTTSAGFHLEDIYSPAELRYWWDGSAWPAERIPRVVYPFYAWNDDEHHIQLEVQRLGLIEPGRDNQLITNNDTIPVMLALDIARLGYSGFEPDFVGMVRAGKAPREFWLHLFEAMEFLARQGRFLPRCISGTLGRLGLRPADIGLPEQQAGAELPVLP